MEIYVEWFLDKYEESELLSRRCLGKNLVTTIGFQNALDRIFGLGGTALSNANAAIAVGNQSTAASVSDTKLDAETAPTGSFLRKGMDTGFPSRSASAVTVRSTFAPAEANFTWNEWGLAWSVTLSTDTLMTRRVDTAMGTKPSNQTWVLSATITMS